MTVAEPSSVRPDAMGERRGAKLVVDMLNDFVTGKFKNPRAEGIVPNIAELLREARHDKDWIVVFSNDAQLARTSNSRWGANTHGRHQRC